MIHQDFIVIILTVKLVIIIQLIRIMVLRCDYHFLNFIIIPKQIIYFLFTETKFWFSKTLSSFSYHYHCENPWHSWMVKSITLFCAIVTQNHKLSTWNMSYLSFFPFKIYLISRPLMAKPREVFSVTGSKLFEFVKIPQRISVSFTEKIQA